MKKLNLDELGWKIVEDNKSDYKFYYKKDDLTMSIRRFKGYSFIRIYKIIENGIIDERFSGNVDEGNEELVIGNYIDLNGRCISGKTCIDVYCKNTEDFNKIYKNIDSSNINLHIKNKNLWFQLLKIEKYNFYKDIEQFIEKQESIFKIKLKSETIENNDFKIRNFFKLGYGKIVRDFKMSRFEIFLFKLKNKFGNTKNLYYLCRTKYIKNE